MTVQWKDVGTRRVINITLLFVNYSQYNEEGTNFREVPPLRNGPFGTNGGVSVNQLALFVLDEERVQIKQLLKAYASMKAAVEIYHEEYEERERYDFTQIDMANTEGRGTRGDIGGRGTKGDIVGNTVILREERPLMIQDYDRKCRAIDRAFRALSDEGREILRRCFVEQKKDKYIYEVVMNIPKSTYDFHKARAIDTVAVILKAAGVI